MDTLTRYRTLLEQLMEARADLMRSHPASGEEVACVFDEQHDHYLLLRFGWSQGKPIHYTTLHARLHDGKIWIEEDLTEEGLANELAEAGVPKEDIVLGFNPPHLRPYTEFAVA